MTDPSDRRPGSTSDGRSGIQPEDEPDDGTDRERHVGAVSRDPLLDRVRDTVDADLSGARRRDRNRSESDLTRLAASVERQIRYPGADDPTPVAGTASVSATQRDPAIPRSVLRQDRDRRSPSDDTPVAQLRRTVTSGWKRLLQVGMVVFVLAVGYYAVSLWQVYSTGRADQARSVDAIVVLGAAQYDGTPSPQLAARLDHVVQLWPQGHAPIVVVTGGKQPGDRFTEAEASKRYLVERAVPDDAILLENDGLNSFDSLRDVVPLLEAHTGVTASSVLIVTDPYHALRSRLIAQEVGLTAYSSPTTTSVVTGGRSLERHLWEAGGVAIGRITGFRWLSDVTD